MLIPGSHCDIASTTTTTAYLLIIQLRIQSPIDIFGRIHHRQLRFYFYHSAFLDGGGCAGDSVVV